MGYWNEYKTKSENKSKASEYKYFLESNLVGVNRLLGLPKGVIWNYNVIINEKNFSDQPIASHIKRHKEIRKLTTKTNKTYKDGKILRSKS